MFINTFTRSFHSNFVSNQTSTDVRGMATPVVQSVMFIDSVTKLMDKIDRPEQLSVLLQLSDNPIFTQVDQYTDMVLEGVPSDWITNWLAASAS